MTKKKTVYVGDERTASLVLFYQCAAIVGTCSVMVLAAFATYYYALAHAA